MVYVAYFAGGCVRDALQGVPPKDIDIATSARPDQSASNCLAGQFRWESNSGWSGCFSGEMEFEVATFRSDGVYLDGRHPLDIRFSTPEQDAFRRDFTINGMFYDPLAERVIDYVDGREDLSGKLVRAIGDPSERFAEDRLRMLRAIRFASTLAFEIESATWSAVKAAAQKIDCHRQSRTDSG